VTPPPLKEISRRLAVIGGGAAGVAQAQGFRRLGSEELTVLLDSCGGSAARSHSRQRRCAQLLKPRASPS
jgi:hypothetical protein